MLELGALLRGFGFQVVMGFNVLFYLFFVVICSLHFSRFYESIGHSEDILAPTVFLDASNDVLRELHKIWSEASVVLSVNIYKLIPFGSKLSCNSQFPIDYLLTDLEVVIPEFGDQSDIIANVASKKQVD